MPSLSFSVPPVWLLFSEYPSVVLAPNPMSARSMTSSPPIFVDLRDRDLGGYVADAQKAVAAQGKKIRRRRHRRELGVRQRAACAVANCCCRGSPSEMTMLDAGPCPPVFPERAALLWHDKSLWCQHCFAFVNCCCRGSPSEEPSQACPSKPCAAQVSSCGPRNHFASALNWLLPLISRPGQNQREPFRHAAALAAAGS
jgi:hypothetical protein